MDDLIQRFPLPIALLDDGGAVLILNECFERTYDPEVLDLAPLQDIIRKAVPGWKTVQVSGRGQGQMEVQAQVVRVRDNLMLILDSAMDPELQRKLDELHVQIAQLERLSSIDSLTGAWNRAHFDRVVASELERSIRFKQPVSLIFLDIDHFKQVNDTYGHQAGDSVLCELVQVIGAADRSSDMLFRWGGEEFVVLAPSTGYRAGSALAERMRSDVEQHRFTGVGPVTISLGVAEHIATESAEIWFHRVDEALYRAKEGGRNRVDVDQRGGSDMWAAESGPSVIRLVWQEAYECGEPTIDGQHCKLFELGNALLDASFKSESSPEVFSVALDKLLAHIVKHFADEEAILAQHGYNDLEPHRLIHAALIARASELKAAVAAGKTTLGDLVEFLANTVVAQHLFKEDRKYFPLFKKHIG
jgi:diguanylate cyclase (GGDEF)-like protein/hemerythrin-like metal-binding protein